MDQQTDEHPFFCDQITQLLASANFEEFIRYDIAYQAVFVDLIDSLHDKITEKN